MNVEVLTEEVPTVEEIMIEGETMLEGETMIVAVITIEIETTTIAAVTTTIVTETTTIVAVAIMAMITEMGTIEIVVPIKLFHSLELKDRFSRIKSSNNFGIYKKVLVDYL